MPEFNSRTGNTWVFHHSRIICGPDPKHLKCFARRERLSGLSDTIRNLIVVKFVRWKGRWMGCLRAKTTLRRRRQSTMAFRLPFALVENQETPVGNSFQSYIRWIQSARLSVQCLCWIRPSTRIVVMAENSSRFERSCTGCHRSMLASSCLIIGHCRIPMQRLGYLNIIARSPVTTSVIDKAAPGTGKRGRWGETTWN